MVYEVSLEISGDFSGEICLRSLYNTILNKYCRVPQPPTGILIVTHVHVQDSSAYMHIVVIYITCYSTYVPHAIQVVSDMQQMKARHVDIVGRMQYAYSDIQQESQVNKVIFAFLKMLYTCMQ